MSSPAKFTNLTEETYLPQKWAFNLYFKTIALKMLWCQIFAPKTQENTAWFKSCLSKKGSNRLNEINFSLKQ